MSIAEKFEVIADAVYDKGKQDEYDAFWDTFQKNGSRKTYAYGISGVGWTIDTFKPKYDLIATDSATFMFCASAIRGDLGEILDELGIKLDTTGCSAMSYMFRTAQFTSLPTIDCTSCAAPTYIFGNMSYLTTIEKWILPTSKSQNFSSAFLSTDKLTNINEIEGTFYKSIDFSYSPLSVETMKTIIGHLENYSGTSSTNVLTFNTDCWSRLEADSSAPDGGTWSEYVQNLGWSI